MPRVVHALFAVAMVVSTGACLETSATLCANGRVCPDGTVCDDAHDGCVAPDQLVTCDGIDDGEDCTVGSQTPGICRDQVCLPARCGDGFVREPEDCDGPLPDDLGDCTDHGFHDPGPVSCSSSCLFDTDACSSRCGDGVVNGGEPCDGPDMGGADCTTFGFYDADGLECTLACTFDVDACTRTCGDDVLDAADGEDCDTDQMALGCQDFGFYDADGITCSGGCTYDTRDCTGFCGDRQYNGAEVCEGKTPPGESCVSLNYDGGELGCLALCAPDVAGCYYKTEWRDESAFGFSYLTSAWAVPGSAYVGGPEFGFLHNDGTGWTPIGLFFQNAISGSAADDVWTVGGSGQVNHYDGQDWTPDELGPITFLGVWVAPNKEVFAVGTGGAAYHHTAGGWAPTISGVPSVTLQDVWGATPSDVFAVGNGGTIVHWNGSGWSAPHDSGTTNALYSVWGSAGDDVYAVGVDGLFHYNGNAGNTWTSVTLPPSSASVYGGSRLWAIWGSSARDVYVVGNSGVAVHYDGVAWTVLTTGTSKNLRAVGGSGSPDVILAGETQTILRHDGTRWSQLDPTPVYRIWARAQDDIYSVDFDTNVRRYDGTSWQVVGSSGGPSLDAIWGDGDDVFAVGEGGTILHTSGGGWSPMTSNTAESLFAVSGTSPDDVFAVGSNGTILHYSAGTWEVMDTGGVTDALYAVWARTPDDVYAGSSTGLILHYDGQAWTTSYVGSSTIYAFGGRSAEDVFAVGTNGTILHYDGTSWETMEAATDGELDDVRAADDGQVYISGENGVVLRQAGQFFELWHTLGAGYVLSLSSVDGFMYACVEYGDDGNDGLYQLDRTCFPDERLCGDGFDDDCDGVIDCADGDCAEDAACITGGECTGWTEIACGDSLSDTTVSGDASLSRYACSDWLDVGREIAYRLTPPAPGDVTIDLTGMVADLDLVVLEEGAGGGCDRRDTGCVAASAATGAESVTFTAESGASYYVIVDGYGAAAGDFTVTVSCP